jgi:hypothetical protein
MSDTNTKSAIVIPTTKRPVPPAYVGLPDSATFGRLASQPDRINDQARAFFESWLVSANVLCHTSEGRLTLKPEARPIGTSAFFSECYDLKDLPKKK